MQQWTDIGCAGPGVTYSTGRAWKPGSAWCDTPLQWGVSLRGSCLVGQSAGTSALDNEGVMALASRTGTTPGIPRRPATGRAWRGAGWPGTALPDSDPLRMKPKGHPKEQLAAPKSVSPQSLEHAFSFEVSAKQPFSFGHRLDMAGSATLIIVSRLQDILRAFAPSGIGPCAPPAF